MTQEYRLEPDQKNRVIIPAKLRERLGSRLILCLAPDDKQGLYVFTPEVWQEIMEPVDAQNLTAQQRFMLMHADVAEVDKQCRITVPRGFMEALHTEHDVTFWFVFCRNAN